MAEPEQICLMSAVSGQLVKDGQPLPNTKLVRELSYVYKDGFHTDEAITDAEGNFSFPAVFENKKRFAFLNAFTIAQSIEVERPNQNINIWLGNKNEASENSEGRGKSIQGLVCDINREQRVTKRIDPSYFGMLCDWDIESDPEPDYGLSEDY